MRRAQTNNSRQNGFTLIELLVVIAIIVILAAIIFPVFASVRENARQSSSINNMRQISTAIAQFELDNHKAPDVLFGYVYYQYAAGTGGPGTTAVSMDSAYAKATADAQAYGTNVNTTFPGLYPEYVRDVSAFRDPNNPDNGDVPFKTQAVKGNTISSAGASSGTLTADTAANAHQFYVDDAYDISPAITGTNLLGTTYVLRYQPSWTSIDSGLNAACTAATTPATCANNGVANVNYYTHQMRWKNPPAETYVTSTTYHVPNAATVIVLWEGGSVKKLSTAQFTGGANTERVTDVSSQTTPGVSDATFWHLVPAGR